MGVNFKSTVKIMFIPTRVFTTCDQINHFYECHFNYILWHMIRSCNYIFNYKMVLKL